MIRLLVLFIVFVVAVAISPILIGEKGYILIAMGDLTIESTVVTAGIFLIVLFVALIISLKIFRGGLRISLGAWNTFAFASQRKGQANFNKGIAAYLLKDYQQAQQLLSKSAEPAKQQSVAYLTAAMAAQHQKDHANAAHYIQLLEHQNEQLKNVGIESVLVQLHILMEQQELEKARLLIDSYHTHIGHDYRLLSLEIELSIIEKRFSHAIDFLVKARKQKPISHTQILNWESRAYAGQFNQEITAGSSESLQQYWQSIARKIKQSDAVLLAYCQVLASHKIHEPLSRLLLPAVKKSNNPTLIDALKTLPLGKVDELLAAVQKHLHNDPNNSQWLSCLGHLACANQDWPMAERAFNSLQTVLSDQQQQLVTTDKQKFAKALVAQNKHQQATVLLLE